MNNNLNIVTTQKLLINTLIEQGHIPSINPSMEELNFLTNDFMENCNYTRSEAVIAAQNVLTQEEDDYIN